MNDRSTPTAASRERARAVVDLLICEFCGGFTGGSCACRNAEHARKIRAEAAHRRQLQIERYQRRHA